MIAGRSNGLPARLAVFLCLVCLVTPVGALAAVFNVDATFDDIDANPGNGICSTGGIETGEFDACTLRAAVMEANALPGDDTIILPAGTYSLTEFGKFDNSGFEGDLDIHESVTIVGAGSTLTIIDASALKDRAIDILPPPAARATPILANNASISGVTIVGGTAPLTEGTSAGGGGLRNRDTLILSDCLVTGNTAQFTEGGGGVLNEGTLLVDNCDITFNNADQTDDGGGGVLSYGAATILDSLISHNSAVNTLGGGGGLANEGTMLVERSILDTNAADDSESGGGGIVHAGQELVLRDSTIIGNSASVAFQNCGSMAGGGGISLIADFAFVSGTTIDGNITAADCEGQPNGGGGVYSGDNDYVFLVNSTISGNLADGAELGGGGLLCDGCFVALFNCTITDNEANEESGFGASLLGGGLSSANAGEIAYENTIVFGNRSEPQVGVGVSGDDCAFDEGADLTSGGFNLLETGTSCNVALTDVLVTGGTSGVFGPLMDNGGPTQTHALVPGTSPAVDTADPLGCTFDDDSLADQPLTTDQRGSARPADGDVDSIVVCDIGSYELGPANPPDCTRRIIVGGPTDEIVGLATDDDSAADTGIFDIQLIEADGVSLLPPLFTDGDPQVEFTVVCVDPTPGDGLCEGTGLVEVTDGEGLTCTLGIDFNAVPEGPLENYVICEDDDAIVQVSNPVPGSNDPITPAGTGACSANDLNDDDPPLGPGRAPFDLCKVFTLDSPVAGDTEVVYKVNTDNLDLRLLFSESIDGVFQPWEDITLDIVLIPDVLPDPTRLSGLRKFSPVKITCAEIIDVDCGDPANIDADIDGDGYSPCPGPNNPNQQVDCDDRIGFVNPGATEVCNGLDDDCDGEVDDGFDLDGDTVADCFDNCPGLPNPPEICDPLLPPYQCDSDGDGLGDACDLGDIDDEDEDGDDENDETRDTIDAIHGINSPGLIDLDTDPDDPAERQRERRGMHRAAPRRR
jgi:hypothetical protein